MGMTDRQFDAYLKQLLIVLEQIEKEVQENGNCVSETLKKQIRVIEEQLKRP